MSVHLSVKCLFFFVTFGVFFKDQQCHLDFPLTTKIFIQALQRPCNGLATHGLLYSERSSGTVFSTGTLLVEKFSSFLFYLNTIFLHMYNIVHCTFLLSKLLVVYTKNLHLESPQLGPQLKEKKNPAPFLLAW